MSLPNVLTICRIAAIPAIVVLVVLGSTAALWIALALYIAAAVTDYIDGALARRMNLSSNLGRMLDPIADKMLVGALIVTFAATGQIAGWDLAPALAILMREIFVAGLREFLGEKQVTLHVSTLAKYKTAAQLVAIGAVLLAGLVPEIGLVADLLLWLAAALTVWTGYHYLSGAWGALTVTVK